jgi:hypothetical protein
MGTLWDREGLNQQCIWNQTFRIHMLDPKPRDSEFSGLVVKAKSSPCKYSQTHLDEEFLL